LLLACGFASQSFAEDFIVNDRYALPFPPSGLDPYSICGSKDDSQEVEKYDGTLGVPRAYVDAHQGSTARIEWLDRASIRTKLTKAKLVDYLPGELPFSDGWCTGTVIAGDYLLTAGHCLDMKNGSEGWTTPFKREPDGHLTFATPEVLATLQVVNFRHQVDAQGTLRSPDVYPVERLMEYREGPAKLDFAVLKLGRNKDGKLPSEVYPVAKVAKRAVVSGELLAILQHPQGEPKRVDAGKLFEEQDSYLYYSDIDTLGGSSGSGILDAKGEIIGVHTRGGCMASGEGANSGVSINAISQVSKLLQ